MGSRGRLLAAVVALAAIVALLWRVVVPRDSERAVDCGDAPAEAPPSAPGLRPGASAASSHDEPTAEVESPVPPHRSDDTDRNEVVLAGAVLGEPARRSTWIRLEVSAANEAFPARAFPLSGPGGFEVKASLPRSAREFVARASGDHCTSIPCVRPVSSEVRDLLLILVESGEVRCRVVDSRGRAVPGATLRLVEIPDERHRPIPTLEIASRPLAAAFVRSGPDGVVVASVRAGTVEVRGVGDDGSLGGPVRTVVTAGATADIGDVAVPSGGAIVRLRVLDEAGPVAGAWVQCADLTMRLGHPSGVSNLPMFETRFDGTLTLGRLAPQDFPLALAVGSPKHEVTSRTLSFAEPEDRVIHLRSRFRFEITVRGGIARSLAAGAITAEEIGLTARCVDGTRAFEYGSQGRAPEAVDAPLPPEAQLGRILQSDSAEVSSTDPLRYVVRGPGPGRYRITLFHGANEIQRIVEAASTGQDVPLEVPEGRVARLVVTGPPSSEASRVTGSVLDVEWTGGDREGRGTVSLAQARKGVVWWIPWDTNRVGLTSNHPITFPTEDAESTVPSGATVTVTVDLKARPGTEPVEFALGSAYGRLPLSNWAVWIVADGTFAPSHAERHGIVVRTKGDGLATLTLRPGDYRATALRSLVKDGWVRFSVPRGPGAPPVVVPVAN